MLRMDAVCATSCKYLPQSPGPTSDLRYPSSGRNVCLYHIFSLCKFGAARCAYSHDNSYLSRGDWDDPAWVTEYRQAIELCGAAHDARKLEALGILIPPPMKGES